MKKIKLIDLSYDIFAGGTPSTFNPDFWTNGIIPWMSSGEVNYKIIKYTEKKLLG